jgi:uncharacterized protein
MKSALSLRRAADQGDATAQLNLGWMHREGEGVPQDYEQALKWLRKAADQGNARAQAALGVMYLKGQGVLQDFAQARMWFNLSASGAEDAGTRELAVKFRGLLAAKMTPAEIAEAQRMAQEWVPRASP